MAKVISLSQAKDERVEIVLDSWELLFKKILDEVKQDPDGVQFALLYRHLGRDVEYTFKFGCSGDELIGMLERAKMSLVCPLSQVDETFDVD